MRTAIVAFLIACASPAHAQDRVIGLLALPELFGNGPCDRFTPKEVKVYAAPDSPAVVAAIRVDRYWTFPEAGGCEGLTVRVHSAAHPAGVDLPTEEYADEAPGAIVVERRGRWFKVRLGDGTGWVEASPQAEYSSLQWLLTVRPAYLTDAFDGRLAPSPGGTRRADPRAGRLVGHDVRVTRVRTVGGDMWLRVEVLSGSGDDPADKRAVIRRGWLPAHAASGEPTVWFHSRD